MKKTITFSLAVFMIAMVASGSIGHAHAATISGTVREGGIGVSTGKVTAETPISTEPLSTGYVSTFTSGSGTWSMTTSDSHTYTVDGMAGAKTHERITGVSGSQSNLDHNLSSRSVNLVHFKIAADEEFRSFYGTLWKSVATDKLNTADPWFRDEHSIGFATVSASFAWDSNNFENDCSALLTEARNESGWNAGINSGADILSVWTKQNMDVGQGGCANRPDIGGQFPAHLMFHTSPDLAIVVMHEISHNYGFKHVTSCPGTTIPNIMDVTDLGACSHWLKNWTPNQDDTLESRRNWY